jgi:hypothetical protein
MIWKASSNQTLFDLAIQLYGDVSFVPKLMSDNNLNYDYQTNLNDEIFYELNTNASNTTQLLLVNNNKTLATGFKASIPPLPPVIQRSYNNDFSLDFD